MAIVRCVSRPIFVSLIDPCACVTKSDERHTLSIIVWQDIEVRDTSAPITRSDIVRVVEQGIGFSYNCSSDSQLYTISLSDSAMFDLLAKIGPILSDCSARWDWLSARFVDEDFIEDSTTNNFENCN